MWKVHWCRCIGILEGRREGQGEGEVPARKTEGGIGGIGGGGGTSIRGELEGLEGRSRATGAAVGAVFFRW